MKKILTIILCISLLTVSFTSCLGPKDKDVSVKPIESGNTQTDAPKTDAPLTDAPTTNAPVMNAPETNAPVVNAPETEEPVDANFSSMEIDWPYYRTADELIEKADYVCIGKINDITFEMLDWTSGMPITEDDPGADPSLFTIFHFEVIKGYKGAFADEMTFEVGSGLMNYKVATQVKLMKEYNNSKYETWGIPIFDGYAEYKIGDYYLLSLDISKSPHAYILSHSQGVIPLKNVTEESLNESKEPVNPKTVIEAFGDDAFEEFINDLNDGKYKGNPETEPPETNPPVTNPPATDHPVTNPPVTEPPVTGEVETDSDPMDQPPETFLPETE